MNLSDEQYQRIRDDIGGYVNGCNEAALRDAIDRAVGDYIRDIGGIVMFASAHRHTNGVMRVHIDAPFGGRVKNVRDVFCHGRKVDHNFYRVTYSDGCAFVCGPVGCHHLCSFQVEWEPSDNTTELPADWFAQNVGAIENCALTRLLSQTTKPWGDVALAAQFDADYKNDVHEALYALRSAGSEDGRINMFDRNETFVVGGF